jgi:hypothetical protein
VTGPLPSRSPAIIREALLRAFAHRKYWGSRPEAMRSYASDPARTLWLVLRRVIACRSNRPTGSGTFPHKMDCLYRDVSSRANTMIRKLASGKYRLYSRKKNPKTGRRRNLGTFSTRTAAEKHERAVQFYKRH